MFTQLKRKLFMNRRNHAVEQYSYFAVQYRTKKANK